MCLSSGCRCDNAGVQAICWHEGDWGTALRRGREAQTGSTVLHTPTQCQNSASDLGHVQTAELQHEKNRAEQKQEEALGFQSSLGGVNRHPSSPWVPTALTQGIPSPLSPKELLHPEL